jgi:hypothetical protein
MRAVPLRLPNLVAVLEVVLARAPSPAGCGPPLLSGGGWTRPAPSTVRTPTCPARPTGRAAPAAGDGGPDLPGGGTFSTVFRSLMVCPDPSDRPGQRYEFARIAVVPETGVAAAVRAFDYRIELNLSGTGAAWTLGKDCGDRAQRERDQQGRAAERSGAEEDCERGRSAGCIGAAGRGRARHSGRAGVNQPDAPPGRTHLRRGLVVAEFGCTGRGGEVPGQQGNPDRYPATEFPGSCGHVSVVQYSYWHAVSTLTFQARPDLTLARRGLISCVVLSGVRHFIPWARCSFSVCRSPHPFVLRDAGPASVGTFPTRNRATLGDAQASANVSWLDLNRCLDSPQRTAAVHSACQARVVL